MRAQFMKDGVRRIIGPASSLRHRAFESAGDPISLATAVLKEAMQKTLALAVSVLTLGALSGSAHARTFAFHGDICRAVASNISGAEYDQYGVHNITVPPPLSGPGTLTVECPLFLDYPDSGPVPTISEVQTQVYDRSTTADISCALEHVDDNGAVLVSVSRSTQGGGPGSGPVGMTFIPPAGSEASGYWRLRCSLPAVQSGAFSHIVGPVVHTTE